MLELRVLDLEEPDDEADSLVLGIEDVVTNQLVDKVLSKLRGDLQSVHSQTQEDLYDSVDVIADMVKKMTDEIADTVEEN